MQTNQHEKERSAPMHAFAITTVSIIINKVCSYLWPYASFWCRGRGNSFSKKNLQARHGSMSHQHARHVHGSRWQISKRCSSMPGQFNISTRRRLKSTRHWTATEASRDAISSSSRLRTRNLKVQPLHRGNSSSHLSPSPLFWLYPG